MKGYLDREFEYISDEFNRVCSKCNECSKTPKLYAESWISGSIPAWLSFTFSLRCNCGIFRYDEDYQSLSEEIYNKLVDLWNKKQLN